LLCVGVGVSGGGRSLTLTLRRTHFPASDLRGGTPQTTPASLRHGQRTADSRSRKPINENLTGEKFGRKLAWGRKKEGTFALVSIKWEHSCRSNWMGIELDLLRGINAHVAQRDDLAELASV
jgi:hypothetical protein